METPVFWGGRIQETVPSLDQLPFHHALQVRSAEYWLVLGKPDQAILEFNRLSADSQKHPLALKVYLRAVRTVLEMNESFVRA